MARMTSKGTEKMTLSTIGMDISKDFLDVHRLPDGETQRFDNTKAGYKALIRWLDKTPIARIVHEPTGALSPQSGAGAERGGAAAGKGQSPAGPPLRRSHRQACKACPREGGEPINVPRLKAGAKDCDPRENANYYPQVLTVM